MLYYVRQKSGTVRVMDVEKLADAIEANSSLTAGDVKHAIEAFVEQLRLSLTQGDKVKIDGLGTFHITLCSEGTEKEKDCTVRSIRKVNVRFVADKALHLVNASHTSTRSENNVEFVLASKGDTEGGNAGGADVELLGRLAGLELQRDFREVRLAQKQAAARQFVSGHFLLRVVRIDDAVHGAVRRVGFARFGIAREVVRDFGKQIELIACGCGARGFHFAHEFAAHLFQLGVYLGKMRLFGGENGVVGRGAERLGGFGCGVFLHSGS